MKLCTSNSGKVINILGIFLLIMHLNSCTNKECKCDFGIDDINYNDSIITKLTEDIYAEGLTSYELYFNQFEQQKLFEYNVEAYRLTINPTHYNFVKIYEISKPKRDVILHIEKYTKSQMGELRFKQFDKKDKILTEKQWIELKTKIKENCFWTLKSVLEKDKDYLDGTQIGIEGISNSNGCTDNKYHMVGRINQDSSQFMNICKEFFDLDSLNMRNLQEW